MIVYKLLHLQDKKQECNRDRIIQYLCIYITFCSLVKKFRSYLEWYNFSRSYIFYKFIMICFMYASQIYFRVMHDCMEEACFLIDTDMPYVLVKEKTIPSSGGSKLFSLTGIRVNSRMSSSYFLTFI